MNSTMFNDYLDNYVNMPIDPRTDIWLTFNCKLWFLFAFYIILSTAYLVWWPWFQRKYRSYPPMKAFIVVYNGFMFGCYGTGVAMAYYAVDGFENFFSCKPIDFTSSDVKASLTIVMAITLHCLKLIRFFEPLMYQIADMKSPFSKILLIEGIVVHHGGLKVAKYYAGNFFSYPTFLDGLCMLTYYAHQTLQVGGFIPDYYRTWSHCNFALQMLNRYIAYKHAVWGYEQSACEPVKRLISIQYWCSIISLVLYSLDLFVNGQKQEDDIEIFKDQVRDELLEEKNEEIKNSEETGNEEKKIN